MIIFPFPSDSICIFMSRGELKIVKETVFNLHSNMEKLHSVEFQLNQNFCFKKQRVKITLLLKRRTVSF